MYEIHGYAIRDGLSIDLGACHDSAGRLVTFPTLRAAEKQAAAMNRAYSGDGLYYAPAARDGR